MTTLEELRADKKKIKSIVKKLNERLRELLNDYNVTYEKEKGEPFVSALDFLPKEREGEGGTGELINTHCTYDAKGNQIDCV